MRTRPDGVLLQHVLPQLAGQQGEHPAARVGQSGGDVLFPVGAGQVMAPSPTWVEPVQVQVRSKRSGMRSMAAESTTVLVYRARREGAGEKAVEVHPVRASFPSISSDEGDTGVKGGGGHHAQHLPVS